MDQPSVEKQSPAAHDDLGQLSLKGDQTPASPTTACTSGEADSDEDTALTSAGCGSTTDSAPTMGEAPIPCNGADEAAGAEHSVASPCGAAHCKEQRKCDAKQGGCCKMQRLLELQGALQKHITTADPKLRSVLLSIQTAALSPTVPTPGHDAVTSLQVATHCCPSSPRSRSTDIAADHKAASHATPRGGSVAAAAANVRLSSIGEPVLHDADVQEIEDALASLSVGAAANVRTHLLRLLNDIGAVQQRLRLQIKAAGEMSALPTMESLQQRIKEALELHEQNLAKRPVLTGEIANKLDAAHQCLQGWTERTGTVVRELASAQEERVEAQRRLQERPDPPQPSPLLQNLRAQAAEAAPRLEKLELELPGYKKVLEENVATRNRLAMLRKAQPSRGCRPT